METKDITTYITEKLQAGVGKREIYNQLSAVGWSDDEIDAAYGKALVEVGVPTPHDGLKGLYAKKASAVEIILNLFSFILLGIVVTALGTLYFGIINHFFPDRLDGIQEWQIARARDAMHYAMAALIVGFPLYYLSVRMWFKAFRESEGKIESKLTKWITYLVLLVASVVIVGDLVAILNTFLQGEISVRFLLKGLTVLAIAGGVFGFYFLERKNVQYRKEIPRKTFQMFGWVLLVVIGIGIVLGFVAAGTPGTERERRFDEERASDLNSLANCVERYAGEFQTFPTSFADLERTSSLSHCSTLKDPETEESYEYSVIAPLEPRNGVWRGTFELCATFSLPAEDTRHYAAKWYSHGSGRECDREDVSITIEQRTLPMLNKQPMPTLER